MVDEKNTRLKKPENTTSQKLFIFETPPLHLSETLKTNIMNANQQEDDDGEEVGKEEETFQFGVPQPNSNDPPITYTVGALRPPRKHAENFITCIRDKSAQIL